LSGGYLLDTSVVSALAPGRQEVLTTAGQWLRKNVDSFRICAVTLSEIQQGISKLRRKGGHERANRLKAWLDAIYIEAPERIISIDRSIAIEAGALSDAATAMGKNPGFPDILIAATAKVHDAELLTRNGRHFAPLGIRFSDPFETASK
jgi:toxin FitB